jgi:hypothetical protein
MSKKKCNKCLKTKQIIEFHKDSSRPDGKSYICKLCDQKKFKKWKNANEEKYKDTVSKWRQKNIEKLREQHRKNAKKYRLKNKEKIQKRKNEYEKKKMQNDLFYRNKKLARKRINNALRSKNTKTNQRTESLIGCSIKEYILYLESKFQKGMTWANQGRWEIDHIIPCCAFDLTIDDEQKKCFHYTNTQPLWKNEHKLKTQKDLNQYSTYHNQHK